MFKKILLVLLVFLFGAGVYYYPKFQRLSKVNQLFSADQIAYNFLNMSELMTSKEVEKPAESYQFPRGNALTLPSSFSYEGKEFETQPFLDSSFTTSIVIIQNDTLTYEKYYLGHNESNRHISWSVAKSFVSGLFGIAMEEGHIKSVDQTVEEYLPQMKGSGYEGVKIKDVLQMSTGVGFNEDYGDFNSDINRWGRGFAWGSAQDDFPATLKREREPGTYNHYVSINTHILGMIIVKATGQNLTDYLREKLWHPLGMEYNSYWLVDDYGMEMALGGLNVTSRDYAKMGQLYLHRGNWQGKQIVPAAWVAASTMADAPHLQPGSDNPNSSHDMGYGYQWWIPEGNQGEFMARGIYNQYIYVNPTTQTVIVKTSANPNFNDLSNPHSSGLVHTELFRAIAKAGMKEEQVELELSLVEEE